MEKREEKPPLSFGKRLLYFILSILLLQTAFIWIAFLAAPAFFEKWQFMIYLFQVVTNVWLCSFLYRKYQDQLTLYNPQSFGVKRFSVKKVIITMVMLVVFYVLEVIFAKIMATTGTVPKTPANQIAVENILGQAQFQMGVASVVFGPIMEELVFRGFFCNYFFNKNTKGTQILAVLISGVIFGLVHDTSFSLYTLYYCGAGWLLGTVYIWTKDIRCSIFVHFFHNLISTIMLLR